MGSAPSKPEPVFKVDEYGGLSLDEIHSLPDLTSYSTLKYLSVNSSNIDVFDLNKLPSTIADISFIDSIIGRFKGVCNNSINLHFSDMSMLPSMNENFSEGSLYIGYSNLSSIDLNTLPKHINSLFIDKCPIENLTGSFQEFTKLKAIRIYKTNIKEIPDLPPSIESIYFNNNQLSQLPELPSTLLYIYCSNNQLKSLPELPEKLEMLECNNNQITSLPKLPSTLYVLGIANNKLTEIPPLTKDIAVDLCGNDLGDLCVVDTVDSSNITTAEYKGKEVKFITLKKGTVMFQSMRKLDSITLNFAGIRSDESYIINPEHRTYFFLHPFNTGYGGITVIYILQKDIKLILGIKPARIKGEMAIYDNYGQYCPKKKYKSKIDASHYKSYCLSDDFLEKFPDVYGWLALGNDKERKHYESDKIVKYGKYVSFYENDIGVIDRPEVAIYPLKERSLVDVITPASKINYNFIINNIEKFNYEPIIVLEENNNFNSYKRIIDRLLSDKGYQGYKIKRSSKDGFYYISE